MNNLATWIDDGEKYAFVGLSIKVEGRIASGIVAFGLWVIADTRFTIPDEWREWLGRVLINPVL